METMKKLLILLFLLPLYVLGQYGDTQNFNDVGPGEYISMMVRKTLGGNRYGGLFELVGPPTHFTNVPDSFSTSAGGAHHGCGLTIGGRVACFGANGSGNLGLGNNTDQANPQFMTVDSLGNVITGHIIQVMCGGTRDWNTWLLLDDGSVYITGDAGLGTRGNGTEGGVTNRPVKIPFPAGIKIKQLVASDIGVALDQNGDVWTWGANGIGGGYWTPYLLAQGTATPNPLSPTKITGSWLPAGVKAKMVAGGSGVPSYFLGTDNHLYGWSYNTQYICIASGSDMSHSNMGAFRPWDITSLLGFTSPIDTIVVNSMWTMVKLHDGTIWGWGSNACANAGNGPGIDYNTYRQGNVPGGSLSPFAFDQGMGEAMVTTPIQLFKGKSNFTKIFGSDNISFFWFATDANDSLYFWGRDKGEISGRLKGCIDTCCEDMIGQYPNFADCNYPEYINPFKRNFVVRFSCFYCLANPSATLCPTYPVRTTGVTAPTPSAGSNQTISLSYTTLFGSTVLGTNSRGLKEVLWTCTIKPPGASAPLMPLQANDTITVSGLTTPGTYTFQYAVTDNNFKTGSSTVQVTVGAGSILPTVNAGVDQSFSLPKNSTTVTGTASGNGGATITGTTWTQTSGPNIASISFPASLSTLISGLIAGTYTFRLTATDSNSNTNYDELTVVVGNVPFSSGSILILKRAHNHRVK